MTKKLYACSGCGDITTGTRSASGKEYHSCPDCCQRVDDADQTDPDDEDRGPYQERGTFPKCPKCGSASESDPCEYRLICTSSDCMHHWTPRGIYLPKRKRRVA